VDASWYLPGSGRDPAAEYAAVRTRAGLLDHGHHGVLEVTGRDRAKFLHAMVSNDIAALAPGQGIEATFLDIHGKIKVALTLWVLEDRILIVTPPGLAAKTMEDFDTYLLAEKAVFRDVTGESALLVLAGPDQATLAATSAKALRYTGRIYFDAAAASDMFIPHAAVAATDNANMVFTQILAIDDVISTTPAKAARKQWFRDYTSRYGSYSGVASFAADAANLIGNAVAQIGGDREQVRSIIETSQIDGLSGPIRITPDNHSGLMPQALTLLTARNGGWRLLS